jgi:hypothetical protein
MSKYSVTRPIEDPREFAIAHPPSLAETAPRQKPAHLLGLYESLLRAKKIIGRQVSMERDYWQFRSLSVNGQ